MAYQLDIKHEPPAAPPRRRSRPDSAQVQNHARKEGNAVNGGEAKEVAPFEKVYRGILRALYEGRIVPGQRLVAPDLMREFGVGRGTIREVLQRLASTGVVTIRPNSGAVVRRMSRSEVVGILEVVEVLIGLAARGAAKGVNHVDVKRGFEMRFAALATVGTATDFVRFLTARDDFYRFLVASSGNTELRRLFPNIQVQMMRTQLRPYDHAADAVDPADYQKLNEAILSGDAHRAEVAGRNHVKKTSERVALLPPRAFEPDLPAQVQPNGPSTDRSSSFSFGNPSPLERSDGT